MAQAARTLNFSFLAKVRSFMERSLALRVDLFILASWDRWGESEGILPIRNSVVPLIIAKMLLKSCAIPPASAPMASNFCE